MGKKVSWFSAIKKAFTPNSKQKPLSDHEAEKKNAKKWGLGKIKHGPLYRKPSSIEKILGDAEKELQIIRPANAGDGRSTPSIPTRAYHHQPQVNYNSVNTGNPTQNQHIAATKIQAACKGYMARRNIRALKGMVRLQGVVRGQTVKRQTMNAMKQMQLLVKVQTQIQSRRINMLENQVMQHRNLHKNDMELESSLGRWNLSQTSEAEQNEDWDDSLLTKEEIEARMQRKVEALMKRERILAYASSHQWFKAGSTQMIPMELRSGSLPWWWIRIEQQLPKQAQEPGSSKNKSTHPSAVVEPSPRAQTKNLRFGGENLNSPTPRSSKSPMAPKATRTMQTPVQSNRAQSSNNSTPITQPKPRTNGNDFSFSMPLRDDDSFTSCPPLSRPNYMTPTISAKAKLRLSDSPSERSPAASTPGQKRRMSFPLGQSFGSIKWKKASSLFSNKDSSSQRMQGNESYRSMSMLSVGNVSVDSTTSMPAALGRKPFNRFV